MNNLLLDKVKEHPYTVTVNSTIEEHFNTCLEAKDYAFCRYCFDGIPKALIEIWNHKCKKVSKDVWDNGVIV